VSVLSDAVKLHNRDAAMNQITPAAVERTMKLQDVSGGQADHLE
jgi:hypothetical protein